MKDNLIKIGPVLLTVVELLIAWVMLGLSDETVTVARAGGVVRAITDASPRPPRVGALLAETAETYEDCAAANKACEMLILAGVAEWANKTRSAIRATEGGREHKRDISNAYTKWATGPVSPDVAAYAVAETEPTREPSAGVAEAQAAFTVGSLVTYRPSASRAKRTEANGYDQNKRLGIVIATEKTAVRLSNSIRLVQVNWGAYGTFWDRVRNLEVVNASR
jgi:hypothetical protein